MTYEPIPLIGRRSERARLEQLLDAIVAGHASFVLLLGEAGIGKTRLLDAAAELGRSRGLRVLRGVAMESGFGLAYLPLLAPLAACTAGVPRTPAADHVRGTLLGEPPSDRRGAGSSDGAGAARLLEAIFEVLRERPTLLLVDDVQWADAATISVLDYLAHRAVETPLAVVAAARDDEREAIERLAIADGRRYAHLPVRPLDRDEVAAQVEAIAGMPLPGPEVDAIFARTSGNPFFVEQVLADRDGGPIAAGPGRAIAAGAGRSQLAALVRRRIAGLSPDARSALDALAILDRPATTDVVAAVAGLAKDTARSALHEATRAGVVVTGPDGSSVRHPVFGEVIRTELAGPDRAALHRRAAQALATAGSAPAAIAEHWWQAGDAGEAWSAAMEAAAAATRSLAFAEVRIHLERALAVWPAGQAGRASAALRAGRAAWVVDDPVAALRLAREAATDLAGDPSVTPLQVLLAQGAFAWDAGDRVAATEAFDRVQALLDEASSPGQRTLALWGLGRARIGQRRPTDAYELAMASADVAREAGLLEDEAEAYLLAGMARAWDGSTDGLSVLERGLRVALASGKPATIGHAHQFVVDMLQVAGNLDRAVQVALAGVEACDRLGLARSHGADLRGRAAMILLELGRPLDAAALLVPAEPRAFSELARARLAVRAGAWPVAEAALARAAVGGAIGGPGSLGGWAELTETELADLRGDAESAARVLAGLGPVPGVWGIDIGVHRALWRARLTGSRPDDEAEVGGLLARHPDTALAHAVRTEIDAHARSRAAGGQPTAAVEAWVASADAWTAAGRAYDACRARLGESRARLVAGDRAGARQALRSATEAAELLRCGPFLAAAEDIARRSRLSVSGVRRRRPDPNEPTAREREVLALLAEGLTNPQIAERLFLSPKTVGIHVSRVLEKLESHTRGAAVAVARRRGFVP